MPLPKPNPGESKKDFLNRCMGNKAMNNEFPDKAQRYAVCNSQWGKKKGGDTTGVVKHKYMSADLIITEEPEYREKEKTPDTDTIQAVAVVGDQFWNKGRAGMGGKPEFCLASALEKGYKTMNGTFHNLDHAQRIEDVVGTHINTKYDKESKNMLISIRPDKNMPAYRTWSAFLEMCRETGKTPNISIETYAEVEDMKASELPEGTDYKKLGLKDDDLVEVEKGYTFVGAATVRRGACSDADGCGIMSDSYSVSAEDDMWIISEEEINMPKRQEEPEKEPEEEEPEEPEGEKKPEEEKSEKVISTLKTKLEDCGKLRSEIEKEKADLEGRLSTLEEELSKMTEQAKEFEKKLKEPVTKKTTPKDTEKTVGERAIKHLLNNPVQKRW